MVECWPLNLQSEAQPLSEKPSASCDKDDPEDKYKLYLRHVTK